MRILSMILWLVFAADAEVLAPDCVYTRYGCTYVIYYDGSGGGDALMSCDGGARWYSYSGRVGTCPGGY